MIAILRRARHFIPERIRRRLRPAPKPWAISLSAPLEPTPLENIVLYAVIGTWMEEDIIADTVRNAFTQGVDRVFIVDNESPDGTVQKAIHAGAERGISYWTDQFECYYQICLMNEFVQYVSRNSEHDHVWWLYIDADEFPRPESGGTIRQLLARLDRQYRVVGARVLNHYPTPGTNAHIAGDHPIDHQPLCEEFPSDICDQRHRKHPLQRWDRSGPRIDASPGFHRAEPSSEPWIEPTESIVIHHFPFRNEAISRRRLDLLWSGAAADSRARLSDPATDHMQARAESLDAVYAGDWAKVRNFLPGKPERGVELVAWNELGPPISPDIRRWSADAEG